MNSYHGLGNINIKNVSLVNKCQHCGCDSETSRCSKCADIKAFEPQLAARKFNHDPKKIVTISGCNVLVNGVVEMVRPSFFLADIAAKALRKSYARHNLLRA